LSKRSYLQKCKFIVRGTDSRRPRQQCGISNLRLYCSHTHRVVLEALASSACIGSLPVKKFKDGLCLKATIDVLQSVDVRHWLKSSDRGRHAPRILINCNADLIDLNDIAEAAKILTNSVELLAFEILNSDNCKGLPEERVGYSGFLQGNISPDCDWLSPYHRY